MRAMSQAASVSSRADVDALKQQVCAAVDALAPQLIDISHQLHANPELAFEEHFAHELLTEAVQSHGLDVQRSAYGLDTAFEARTPSYGTGATVAMICEYDALPGIGHACGHNIIAAAGLGAGLAAAVVAEQAQGQVAVFGTPAEEGGGGKELMMREGAFADVDVAMMIHPANHDLPKFDAVAVHRVTAKYTGQAAHASAAPEHGRNALDAAVLGYNAIAALRQHIHTYERIHGVFTDGGDKPNIVPASAAAEWYVRSKNLAQLEPLKERVTKCLLAGAEAAGCEVELTWADPPYADMNDIDSLVHVYCKNIANLGRDFSTGDDAHVVGSTDMGNVSYKVPSIHPMIKVSPADVPIHTPDFANYAQGPEGDAAVIDGAKALAMTAVDCWFDGTTLETSKTEFAELTSKFA